MNESDTSRRIGVAVGFAAYWSFLFLAPFSGETTEKVVQATVLAALSAAAIGLGTGMVWSRIEAFAARPAARCEHPVKVRFSDEEPRGHFWLNSPQEVIGAIEGQPLHRRLVVAARDLITADGVFAPLGGHALSDRGEPFVAVLRGLPGDEDGLSHRRLIIVRDPSKVADEASATGREVRPVVTEPSILAAVVTYGKDIHGAWITADELHALDAAYVVDRALRAWKFVAFERGLVVAGTEAAAKFGHHRIVWNVTLKVLTSEFDEDDVAGAVEQLLADLRVPVEVTIERASPDSDAEEAAAAVPSPFGGSTQDWATLPRELAAHHPLFEVLRGSSNESLDRDAIEVAQAAAERVFELNREVGPGGPAMAEVRAMLWEALGGLVPPEYVPDMRIQEEWDRFGDVFALVRDGEGTEGDSGFVAAWLGDVLRAHLDLLRELPAAPEHRATVARRQPRLGALHQALVCLATAALAVLAERGAA